VVETVAANRDLIAGLKVRLVHVPPRAAHVVPAADGPPGAP
jgi:hypothetical protein